MPTTKPATAPRKRQSAARPVATPDTGAEMAEVMKKLQNIEAELAALLERSVCNALHATGEVARDVNGTVRELVGNAFKATRDVAQTLLKAGTRTADAGRTGAHDAAATVQDFGRIASEAVRQVMAGAAEGAAVVRAAHARPASRPSHH